eukprot:TRINITY_DN476_c0_g2_i9.p2 TRINITY_DN476_c0_g2~~TRINITY_DN476_c0_g2_i9.p2  ORF type:complete len:137 (-),score=22.88 TRINITY_DN476_c0_g2_i9:232-642(-)
MGRNLMEELSPSTLHSHAELQEEEVDPMEVAVVMVGVIVEEVGAGVMAEEVIGTALGQVTDIPVAVRGVVHLDMTEEVDIATDLVLMIDPVAVAAAGEGLGIIDLLSIRKSILIEFASLPSFFAKSIFCTFLPLTS